MLEQLKFDPRRGVFLIIDDRIRGKVDLEHFANHHVCLHYGIDPPFRRMGWTTRMVDMVYLNINPNLIHWTDDPFYKIEHCRSGIMSEVGRQFADAYRTRNNIPLPNMMWENMCYVRRK